MTDAPKPRYMDWLESPAEPQDTAGSEQPFPENVVIMPEPRSERWYALWAVDEATPDEDFSGSREEAIAWARARCDNIRIWADELNDIRQLTSDD